MKKILFLLLFPVLAFGQTKLNINQLPAGVATTTFVNAGLSNKVTKSHVRVYLLAGESNPAGEVPIAEGNATDTIVRNNVYILNNTNLQLEKLHVGVNSTLGVNSSNAFFGPEVPILETVAAGDTVYIIKIAYAGATAATLLTQLSTSYARIDTAMAQIRALGKVPVPYIYYSQGINDLASDTTVWKNNTALLIRNYRYHIGYAPVLITQFMTGFTGFNTVIANLPNSIDWIYPISAAGTTTGTNGAQHWNKAGLVTMWTRMQYVINNIIGTQQGYLKLATDKAGLQNYGKFNSLEVDGNITVPTDNTSIAIGSTQDFGLVRKSGFPAFLAVGLSNQSFFRRSSTSTIAAASTYTDILTLDASNNLTAAGGITLGGDNNVFAGQNKTVGLAKKAGTYEVFAAANGFGLRFGNWSTSTLTPANISSGTFTEYMRMDNGGKIGIHNTAPASDLEVTTNGLGVTTTVASGLRISNTTAATSILNQISPQAMFRANAWNNSSLVSHPVDFFEYATGATGNPVTGTLIWENAINSGTRNRLMSLSNSGLLSLGVPGTTAGSIVLSGSTSGSVGIAAQATGTNVPIVLPNTLPTAGLSLVQNGTNTALTWANPAARTLVVSAAGTLTLVLAQDYVFSGTTATWTLPAITTNAGGYNQITIKNRGTGTITLNSNAGGNDIYDSAAVATIAILPGNAVTMMPDGTYFCRE